MKYNIFYQKLQPVNPQYIKYIFMEITIGLKRLI